MSGQLRDDIKCSQFNCLGDAINQVVQPEPPSPTHMHRFNGRSGVIMIKRGIVVCDNDHG